MCTRRGRMPEENKRLIDIYRDYPELNMLEVIDKYASDEFKEMIKEEDSEDIETY